METTNTKSKTLAKTLTLNKIDYFNMHLSLVNCLLPVKMSHKEIEILACALSFDGILANDRFSTTGKKIIRQTIKPEISHPGLSNYMKSLKQKGFLVEKEGRLEIIPLLHPNKTQQDYMFRLIAKN